MKNKKILLIKLLTFMLVMCYFCFVKTNIYAKVYNDYYTSNEDYVSMFEIEINKLIDNNKHIFKSVAPSFTSKLIKTIKSNNNILIGVIGETASGKSSVVKKAIKTSKDLNISSTFISLDNYYEDTSDMLKNGKTVTDLIKDGYSFDCPNAFNMKLIKSDLKKIKKGKDIYLPEYKLDGTGISVPNKIHVKPEKIVLVEGIASSFEDIPDIFDITVYIDVDVNIRKERWYNRTKERNMGKDNIDITWNRVNEEGKKYIVPMKDKSDVVIDNANDIKYVSDIITQLYKIINKYKNKL